MLGQTFDWIDAPRLIALAFLEILLSSDNAIVLSLLTHALPERLRRKALWIGVASSFLFRAGAILFISFILNYLWLQVVGGIYLLFLAFRHFCQTQKRQLSPPQASFWKTVLYIELFDLAFAIDSIVAGVAFITGNQSSSDGLHPKLWIVYAGGMLGLIAIRYAADIMSRLIDRFPRLETSAYLMVGWIGIKLMTSWVLGEMAAFDWIFWSVLIGLFFIGCRSSKKP